MPFTVACARRPRVNAPKIQEIFCFYCRNRNWKKSNAVLSLFLLKMKTKQNRKNNKQTEPLVHNLQCVDVNVEWKAFIS